MQEDNPIHNLFQNQMPYLSIEYIKSASKWSMFLGVVISALGVLILIPAALSGIYANKFKEIFEVAADRNPQAIFLANMGGHIFMFFLILVALMLFVQGYFYIKFAKAGSHFAQANSEDESIQCFNSLSHIFLLSFIFSVFTLVVTVGSIFLMSK